jgi:hypothetical protein
MVLLVQHSYSHERLCRTIDLDEDLSELRNQLLDGRGCDRRTGPRLEAIPERIEVAVGSDARVAVGKPRAANARPEEAFCSTTSTSNHIRRVPLYAPDADHNLPKGRFAGSLRSDQISWLTITERSCKSAIFSASANIL